MQREEDVIFWLNRVYIYNYIIYIYIYVNERVESL